MTIRRNSSGTSSFSPTRLTELIKIAIGEWKRTESMTAEAFLEDFRKQSPEFPFPAMVDGYALTLVETDAIAELAQISRKADTVLSKIAGSDAWARAVKSAYVSLDRTSIDKDPASLADKIVSIARSRIEQAAANAIHYLPCYLFETATPRRISVGNILFIAGVELAAFIENTLGSRPQWRDSLTAIEHAVTASTMADWRALAVWEMSKFPWVAVVPTNGFEFGMARRRAIDMTRLAIAGLGLHVSPRQCTRLSLAYEWCRPPLQNTLTQIPGRDASIGTTANHPQVRTDDQHLQAYLSNHEQFLNWLGEAIHESFESLTTAAAPCALRQAWLNGLHWYYTGCLETSDARATICYCSALEALSDGIGAPRIVEMLECVLSIPRSTTIVQGGRFSLESATEYIYGFGRSGPVHGGTMVLFDDFLEARGISAELTRYALISYQQHLLDYESQYKRAEPASRKDVFLKTLQSRLAQNQPPHNR